MSEPVAERNRTRILSPCGSDPAVQHFYEHLRCEIHGERHNRTWLEAFQHQNHSIGSGSQFCKVSTQVGSKYWRISLHNAHNIDQIGTRYETTSALYSDPHSVRAARSGIQPASRGGGTSYRDFLAILVAFFLNCFRCLVG